MTARVPALLGALALGAVALTGCSVSSADADVLVDAAPAHANAQAADTTGQVTVTPLTEDEFRDHAVRCETSDDDDVKVCQSLFSSGVGSAARVAWTAWVAVPAGTASYVVQMDIGADGAMGFDDTARAEAQDQYVELQWQSPGIPSLVEFGTAITVDLGGSSYTADCSPTYDGHGNYDMEECTPPNLND